MSQDGGPAAVPASGSSEGCGEGGGLLISIGVVVLLFFLIMGLAGSVDIATLKAQFHRKFGICCGLCCQFFVMPFIGFVVVKVMRPASHVGLTLLILCSSSGGAYSNWWCSLFNADLALSVAMTAVSTLISAVMLPLNLTLYLSLLSGGEETIEIPWAALLQGVATVCAAIGAGVAVSTKLPRAKKTMNRVGNLSGVLMILITGVASMMKKKPEAGSSGPGEEVTPIWGKEPVFYLTVATPFLISLLSSLAISSMGCLQLERPERVAIIVEVSYQNVGIASAVALAAFCDHPRHRADAAAVPIVYGLIEAVALACFCLVAWKCGWTYAPAEASLLTILRGDYQPTFAEAAAAHSDACDADSESDGKTGKKLDAADASTQATASPAPSSLASDDKICIPSMLVSLEDLGGPSSSDGLGAAGANKLSISQPIRIGRASE